MLLHAMNSLISLSAISRHRSARRGLAAATGILWRQEHFGTITVAGDAADPDGDGQVNADEFTAGTHPKNGADRFKVEFMVRSCTEFAVLFSGKTGRSCRLERSISLGGAWNAVQSTEPGASDGPVTIKGTNPLPGRAFYRVVVTMGNP